MKQVDDFFNNLTEPNKSFLLALKHIVQQHIPQLQLTIKYGLPFFTINGRLFCYFWTHKKFNRQPYISFMDGYRMQNPALLQEKRARAKIFLMDPQADIPLATVKQLLNEAIAFYKQ